MQSPLGTVFADFDVDSNMVTVNGHSMRWPKAVTTFRKEKMLSAYFNMCQAFDAGYLFVGKTVEHDVPSMELPSCMKHTATAFFGPEVMMRFTAVEPITYTIRGKTFTIQPGYEFGWFLYTPQNFKNVVRDRTSFICEKSYVFGDIIGRCSFVNAQAIGYFKDSVVEEGCATFVELVDSVTHRTSIMYTRAEKSRLLHSHVTNSSLVDALVSSSRVETFTLISSQVTDTDLKYGGLKDSSACSKKMRVIKITESNIVGKNDLMEHAVESPVIQCFHQILIQAGRKCELKNMHAQLKEKVGYSASADKAVEETSQALRDGSWQQESDKEDGGKVFSQKGRVELDVSGETQKKEYASHTPDDPVDEEGDLEDDDLDDDDDIIPIVKERIEESKLTGTIPVSIDELDEESGAPDDAGDEESACKEEASQ